ncbi:hypothetical protein B0J14DRAFT_694636 [Halenospora varia]|nr:hypothetical protein B0J14DRAFT_694636 [Halenospora varia]
MEHPAADDSDQSSEDESFDPFNWIGGVERPSNPTSHGPRICEICQADRQYIDEKLKIHGNTIEKRWKKWSHAKREATLRQVDKDLYEKRWPEVQILCDFTAKPKATLEDHIRLQAQLGQRPIRNALLLPYRNLELLKSDPKPLLALLNSRTKYSSQEWASFDNHIISKPWEQGILQLIHNPNAIIMHGASYGQLVLWDSQFAHDWRAVGFPKSILVLEAQHELLKFLKKAVDVMLVGVVADTNTVSRPSFRFTSTDLKRWNIAASSEFASTYLFQPFFAPPKFDVDTMISLATT